MTSLKAAMNWPLSRPVMSPHHNSKEPSVLNWRGPQSPSVISHFSWHAASSMNGPCFFRKFSGYVPNGKLWKSSVKSSGEKVKISDGFSGGGFG